MTGTKVMTQYLIIGSGRWATHLKFLLSLGEIPFRTWNRKQQNQKDLKTLSAECSHIWFAISDQSIQELGALDFFNDKIKIHSSGALEFEGIHSVHPLMSFSIELYSPEFYKGLNFVTTSDLPRQQLIPKIQNSLHHIQKEEKAYYHAMCVLAGNGSVLLWQKFISEMQRMGISQEASLQYCTRVFQNILSNPQTALTGPLVRGDRKTLLEDLRALESDPYQNVLQGLIQAYHQSKGALT